MAFVLLGREFSEELRVKLPDMKLTPELVAQNLVVPQTRRNEYI